MRQLVFFVTAAMLLVVGGASAQSEDFPREESFVYATTYFDGAAYNSGVITPNVDTIYMLADTRQVIAPRNTLIYYWALTNEYLADWNQKNELVEGTLEIVQGGQVIAEASLTEFVIQYDAEDILSTVALIDGPDAVAAYEAFENLQSAFQEASFAYFRAEQAWELEMREIVRNNPPGTVAEEDLPVRPEPPAPFSLFSTDLIEGYVVDLPQGRYQVRMRLSDGTIQPGSEKQLVMFSPLRSGVSYQVTPQSRWTRPEESRRPASTIYAPPGTTLYLRPYDASAVNSRAQVRMNNPHDRTAPPDRVLWIPQQPIDQATAVIQEADGVSQTDLSAFYVRQLVRDSRGYDIIPWDESVSEQPSFDGFSVDVGNAAPVQFALVDDAGEVIPGSEREVRALFTGRVWLPYLLAFIPMLAGVVSYTRRQRETRRVREGAATA
jgi:hypothetical protein